MRQRAATPCQVLNPRTILPAICSVLLLASAGVRPLAAQRATSSPFHSPSCPVPAGVAGYPLAVEVHDVVPADSAYAAAVAEALARRWETPSPMRGRQPGVAEVGRRLVPPVPIWADDWFPQAKHLALARATLHRDGGITGVEITSESGDRLFERSLPSVFAVRPADAELPRFPSSVAADSLRLTVWFGEIPVGGAHGVARFAAQQTPVRVVSGSMQLNVGASSRGGARPADQSASIKYDVSAEGWPIAGSIQVLRSSDAAFSRAISEAIPQLRFTPATANCQPIARSVVQQFGRR
jgi:hypothetical protein